MVILVIKKNKKNFLAKTQNHDLFISPTNNFHKMDFFFGEKAMLEESNEHSLGKLR